MGRRRRGAFSATGLGLADVGLDAEAATLSGGERRRVALAAALVQQADLLVLDEPTNHLDVEGVTWLAAYLSARRAALLVVTHDRWFLDAVVAQTWEVADATVRQYEGGYAAYVLARAERARQASASEARRQNLLRKELAWLRRGAPARTSKPRFRIDAAEALIADVPSVRSSVELRALSQRRLGRSVYELDDVTMRVGDRTLLDHVSWHVGPGDRVGIIGVNGSGKTHLLRLLAGELAPSAGRVQIGQTVHAGYLSQEVAELPSELRVLEAVQQVRERAELGGVELTAGQLAERFGFGNDKQWTPVADLSGGERRRLQLLRLLLAQPNVLLLDEPTNDLDTDTLTALEDLLDSWPGTLVVVSHDRYLVERVCDTTVALLGDGSLAALPGGIDEYLARRASSKEAKEAEAKDRRTNKGDSRAAPQGTRTPRTPRRTARDPRSGVARRAGNTCDRLREGRRTRRAVARGRRRARGRRGGVARPRRRVSAALLSVRGHPAPEHAEREVGVGIDEATQERGRDDLVLMHSEPVLGAAPFRRGPSRGRAGDGRDEFGRVPRPLDRLAGAVQRAVSQWIVADPAARRCAASGARCARQTRR